MGRSARVSRVRRRQPAAHERGSRTVRSTRAASRPAGRRRRAVAGVSSAMTNATAAPTPRPTRTGRSTDMSHSLHEAGSPHPRAAGRPPGRAAGGGRGPRHHAGPVVRPLRRAHPRHVASEIRALFAVASRPEVVSLAGGMPNIAALPLDAVAAGGARPGRRARRRRCSTAPARATPRCASRSATVMALEGISAHADDVVVTVGSQQALDLVTRIFCDPGDVVLAEAPSYVGALGVFRAYQADVVHVAMDADGLAPEALDATLDRAARRRAHASKLLYTVPNFHNPAGVTLSLERRPQVLEIASRPACSCSRTTRTACSASTPSRCRRCARWRRRRDLPRLVLQDVRARLPRRLGGRAARRAREARAGRRGGGAVPADVLAAGGRSATSPATTGGSRSSSSASCTASAATPCSTRSRTHLPGAVAGPCPHGGFYVWASCRTASTPRRCCRARSPPGSRTCRAPRSTPTARRRRAHHLRLSYCYPTPERIREGVRRLAGVIAGELDLLETFGAGRPARGTARRAAGPFSCTGSRVTARRTQRSSCSPAGCRTSATSRCAPAGAWPRRCASGVRGARPDVDAGLLGAAARRPARRRLAAPARRDRRGRLAARRARRRRRALRRLRRRRLPPRLRQADRQGPRRAARASATRTRSRCRTAVPRARRAAVLDALVGRLGLPLVVKPARGGSALGVATVGRRRTSCRARWSAASPTATPRWSSARSTAPRSRSRSSTPATARARCPPSRSSPAVGRTTTPRATPPARTEYFAPGAARPTPTADALRRRRGRAHTGARPARPVPDRPHRRRATATAGRGSSRSTWPRA